MAKCIVFGPAGVEYSHGQLRGWQIPLRFHLSQSVNTLACLCFVGNTRYMTRHGGVANVVDVDRHASTDHRCHVESQLNCLNCSCDLMWSRTHSFVAWAAASYFSLQ